MTTYPALRFRTANNSISIQGNFQAIRCSSNSLSDELIWKTSMNESKRCISVCTIAQVISKVIPWKDAVFAKNSLSITTNMLSATLPHWTRRHSECQDRCLITPPKLWSCYCHCWVGGKWLVSSLESYITSSSQQSSMKDTLASSISLFLPHLTQGLMKHHLHRLQQWSDQKSSPLLGLKKKIN